MFDRDFTDIEGGKPLSQEDRKFLKILKEGIHLTDDGHYEMPLPLRDKVELPCNRKYAETRLNQLKRRLDRDPKYKKDYVAFVNDMIKNGYAEPADPSNTQRSWYIPHHGVYHPKKTDKIRVVFDCSAEFAGQSLNRHLLQVPEHGLYSEKQRRAFGSTRKCVKHSPESRNARAAFKFPSLYLRV